MCVLVAVYGDAEYEHHHDGVDESQKSDDAYKQQQTLVFGSLE